MRCLSSKTDESTSDFFDFGFTPFYISNADFNDIKVLEPKCKHCDYITNKRTK